jgi:methyl-accepting chemotaxis protein
MSFEQQRKAQWIERMLVIFLIIGGISIAIGLIQYGLSPGTLTTITAVGIIAGLYWFNRQGWVALTAICLTGVLLVAVMAITIQTASDLASSVSMAGLMVIPIATSGVFLSWRAVLGSVVVASLFAGWFYLVSDSSILAGGTYNSTSMSGILQVLITMFVATGVLSWLSSRIIGETVRDLQRRNRELETAYGDLASQTQREYELGQGITDLANELSAVSARQVTGVSSQEKAINEVVSTVAELHAAAEQIALVAGEVSKAADVALRSVARAQELVGQSREAVGRNRAQVQVVIERMLELQGLTTSITDFVNEIRELSDETHLLALNATIEAAGAGPFGRRFSVVAGEVQTLAGRSNLVVDQIREQIESLQAASGTVRSATLHSVAVADEVEALSDEVRQAQEQVVGAVNRTTDLLRLIASATHQQTSATQQVTHTMQQIAQTASSTSSDTNALDNAVREMMQAADTLNAAMSQLHGQRLAEA